MAWAAYSLAPRVPTKSQDLEQISKLSKLKKGQTFLEFGCGTARVATYVAKKNLDANVIGIEFAIPLFFYSWLKQKISGPKNLKIVAGNAFKYSFKDVDVVYVFGLPNTVNKKMQKKVREEFKKGSKLISYIFELKNWDFGKVSVHKSKFNDGQIHVFEM